MFTFDFETKAILPRPDYPPQPVGLAVRDAAGRSQYLAWGHPDGNDEGNAYARAELMLHMHWREPLLCHHAAFDIAVAHERMGLLLPDGLQVNDTMFLAFLFDPYGELSLKPLAERHLGLPPVERDRVRDYLYTHRIIKRNVKKWGAYISEAPGTLVGEYACGDVDRTYALYDFLAPIIREQGMWEAYRRECEILPMLLDNSERGIPLDRARLERDTAHYEAILVEVEQHLRMLWPKDIGYGEAPENFDSGAELALALSRNPNILLPRTPTGKLSTAKEALTGALWDGRVKGLLLYRSALVQCLETYMRPWLEQGEALHCNWNQVRDYGDRGAKTGRLSSSPNFQNVTNPEKYEELWEVMKRCHVAWPEWTFPNLRSYIVAPPGMIIFSRDYSQQEFRLLAHFEDGPIAQAYRNDPSLDMHQFTSELIHETTGRLIERKPTKTINFGKIYGMGGPGLSRKLAIPVELAYSMFESYDRSLPSVKALMREVCDIGKRGDYVTTIGGRRYYAPPATYEEDNGGVRTYEYKLLNYLIQGSAGDQTKQAMRLWWDRRAHSNAQFLLTLHDQLVGCCPIEDVHEESQTLQQCMEEAFLLDVPVRTDATYGFNFGEMSSEVPMTKKRRRAR